MAVELCKVGLWMEALEPGKPLSFLEHHIQCGNSLLGATPRLLREGIPDDAFKPIEGDDKSYCSQYRKRNRDFRKTGQLSLFDDDNTAPWQRLGDLATGLGQLDTIADDTIEGVQRREERYAEIVRSTGYKFGRMWADAWCAAFVWKKRRDDKLLYPITEEIFRRLESSPHRIPHWMQDEIQRLASQYQFFHWHLAFPDVFRVPGPGEDAENEQAGWRGGFDVVLGNPPWERLKLSEDEWFAEPRPDIAKAPNAAKRQEMIARLREEDQPLYERFLEDKRRAEGESHLIRSSGRYPLCGQGDINTYAVFAEHNKALQNPTGRIGCVLQAGIATDKTCSGFFNDLVVSRSLVSLYSFDNHEGVFPGVKSSTRFCLMTLAGRARPFEGPVKFAFYARSLQELHSAGRLFVLTPDDISRLNPNTGTCPVFRSAKDASLVAGVYRRTPVLVDEKGESDEWGLTIRRVLDMNKPQVLAACVSSPPGQGHLSWLTVWEGKLIDQLNHRGSTYDNGKVRRLEQHQLESACVGIQPRYWLPEGELVARLPSFWDRRWLLVWQDVTDVNTMSRTVISTVLPLCGTDFTLRVGFPGTEPPTCAVAFVANLNSFVFDYVARQKIGGTHLSDYILRQLPVISPRPHKLPCPWSGGIVPLGEWLLARVLELTFTAWDLKPFAEDCGHDGPPFRWDEGRRFLMRCELDAAYFHLYLGTPKEWRETGTEDLLGYFPTPRDAVDYIMDTFPIVKRKDEKKHGEYRTKRTILEIYDAMQSAIETGAVYRTLLNPPPGPPAEGLPEWRAGQPRPAEWPEHIHPPIEAALEHPEEAPPEELTPTAYPSSPADEAICAAALAIVEQSGDITSMDHLDALLLATHPDWCRVFLESNSTRKFHAARQAAPSELPLDPSGSIHWKECRDYLEERGAISVNHPSLEQVISPASELRSIRAEFPGGVDGLVEYALKALERVHALQQDISSVPEDEQSILRALDEQHRLNGFAA